MLSLQIVSLLILATIFDFSESGDEETIPHGINVDGTFPYMVKVQRPFGKCSGCLISATHVLTSAVCVSNVDAHSIYVITATDPNFSYAMAVTKIIIHPRYRKHDAPLHRYQTKDNNIAVIKIQNLTSVGYYTHDHILNVTAGVRAPYGPNISFEVCIFVGGQIVPPITYPRNRRRPWCRLRILEPSECARTGPPMRSTEFCAKTTDPANLLTLENEGSPLVCDGHIVGIYTNPVEPRFLPRYSINGPPIFVKVISHHAFIVEAMQSE